MLEAPHITLTQVFTFEDAPCVEVPERNLAQAQRFVDKLEEDGRYSWYTGQRGASRPKQNHFDGVIAEFGVDYILHQLGYPRIGVDTSVNKSGKFDCDLPYENWNPLLSNVHVKSTSSIFDGKISWTVQCSKRPGHKDHRVMNPVVKDVLAGTFVEGANVKLLCLVSTQALHDFDAFQDPILDKYRGNKKCIYHDYLQDVYFST